jgi:hypothetical protein
LNRASSLSCSLRPFGTLEQDHEQHSCRGDKPNCREHPTSVNLALAYQKITRLAIQQNKTASDQNTHEILQENDGSLL